MKNRHSANTLFEGDDLLFKACIKTSLVYGEYGVGASTVWAARNTRCKIFGVDSSIEWTDKIRQECAGYSDISLMFADVGPVAEWGRPISYEKASNFSTYTDWIWRHKAKPDIVLVDGRFRVCCFLTCLINANKGTKILFDDYTNRPHYHYIEKYLKPVDKCGRQALFIVPDINASDSQEILGSIEHFRFVFD